jgi:hypothetical protein
MDGSLTKIIKAWQFYQKALAAPDGHETGAVRDGLDWILSEVRHAADHPESHSSEPQVGSLHLMLMAQATSRLGCIRRLEAVLKECDEYLSRSPLESIGADSILHGSIRGALADVDGIARAKRPGCQHDLTKLDHTMTVTHDMRQGREFDSTARCNACGVSFMHPLHSSINGR